MMKRKYGYIRDSKDGRDAEFADLHRLTALKLPTKVDLTPGCSPVEDQGQLGSCTANAIVGGLEFLEIKEKLPFADLSRLMLYYDERVIEGTVSQDAGAQIRDGIKSMASTGVCPERMWPYTVSMFKTKPTAQCFTDAAAHRISTYSRLSSLGDMLNCLAQGFPFVFGCDVFAAIESDQVAQTGRIPMPKKGEQPIGGHAMLCVGYSQKKRPVHRPQFVGLGLGSQGVLHDALRLPERSQSDNGYLDDQEMRREDQGQDRMLLRHVDRCPAGEGDPRAARRDQDRALPEMQSTGDSFGGKGPCVTRCR